VAQDGVFSKKVGGRDEAAKDDSACTATKKEMPEM
jgi:hypothetical protein